jgi:hypothetical protein
LVGLGKIIPMLNIYVGSIEASKSTAYREGPGPVHIDMVPGYSTILIDGSYWAEIDIRICPVNQANATMLHVVTTFDIGDKPLNTIPTTADNWLVVDLTMIAIDHARVIFYLEQPSMGMANDLGYLPLFDRQDVFERLKIANFSAMN